MGELMQTIQWTDEIIIACGVIVLACILLGYFIASLLQGRQLKLLAMQLEQGQATAAAQQQALQEKLSAAEGRGHELQVIEGKLQAQLRADGAFLERTIAELQEYKKSAVGLGTKIEQQAQQHHDALTRLESAQADGRALKDRVADLGGRLEAAQKKCDLLEAEGNRQKDLIATETRRAELAEASDREAREQLAAAKKSLAAQLEAFSALQDRYQPLSTDHAELRTALLPAAPIRTNLASLNGVVEWAPAAP
jgi:DNA recombination protein RmuC